MAEAPETEPADEPAYRTDCGPLVGPARCGDVPSAIGVHDPDIKGWTLVGMAISGGRLDDLRGGRPVAVFRLVIGKVERPGRYVLVDRRFVDAQEWEEAQADRP